MAVKPFVHPLHQGLWNGNRHDYNHEVWEFPQVTKLRETKTFPDMNLQHLQLILVLKTTHWTIWVDMTKGGEVMWPLKAIEQNINYFERSLDFVLKLIGYCNNQSDLGLQCSGSQQCSGLTMFRLTTCMGASIKAMPFKSDPLHKWRIILRRIAPKVDGSQVARFLKRTSTFEWYVLQSGSKSKHHIDTCLKEIRLSLQILITTLHSILDTTGRTYVSQRLKTKV